MRRLVSIVIVGALLGFVSPAAQAAPRLQCGALITRSTTLKADLTCPVGTALQVQTDGAAIVLDLGGHKVRGSGAEIGVLVSQGEAGGTVTVRNGSVTGFSTGISLLDAPGSRVRDVTVVGPGSTQEGSVGVAVKASPEFVLDDVRIKGARRGLQVQEPSSGGQVRDSTLSGNGIAVLLPPTVSTFTVVRSRIADNEWGFTLSQSGMTLLDSQLVRNGVGISLFQSGAVVRRSTFADNGVGLSGDVLASKIKLSDSTVRDNGTGVELTGFGLRGTDNTIEGSTFRGNGGPGLVVDLTRSSPDSALRIAGNRFEDNGDDPVTVGVPGATDQGAVIRVVEGGSLVVVADNRARRNAGIGIDAVGVTDGGGNTARGNDGPSQCVGVVCGR